MKFPGYWVEGDQNIVVMTKTVFEETELDPETD